MPSTQKALKRAGITVKDLDIVESNEAFAVQAMTVAQELGFNGAKVNLDGGALALGHPLGATGARITGKAAQLLKREGGRSRFRPSASAAVRGSPRSSKRSDTYQ